MLARHIARCTPVLAAALMAAACSAQVMGAPGTLPNGRHIPLPPGQQMPPETTPQQAPQQPQPAPANQAAPASAPAAPAELTPPSLLDKPAQPATVSLSGGRLSVTADNSSLTDILHQLASTSGMTIDGLDKDSRVFGTYGPGNPRDILSALLDGAGYNVMMIGHTVSGTPRQLLLTVRSNAPISQPQARPPVEQDDEQDDNAPLNNYPPAGDTETHPPAPPPQQPPQQNPNGSAKTPQQILQEMMQQRQQQGQQQNPPQ